MNSQSRRRDDRAPPLDPYRQWTPPDKYPPDYDPDRRRNRSATVPSHPYGQTSYPSQEPRYNDPRQPSRSHRQDPHYPSASSTYHQPSPHPPSTSKAYQHATRTPAQHPTSGHPHPQPTSYHPSHPTPAYPAAGSSRRPHPNAPDSRPSRRIHNPTYDHVSSGEDMPRASRPSRPVHSSMQPSFSAPANQPSWSVQQEHSASRRHKDAHRDRDRDQERERERIRVQEKDRERDKPSIELENRHKDRARAERYRERERERATEVRPQDSSKSRHDRRKDSDTEGVLYPEQKNVSKASLSGKEGYSSAREPGNAHRRHRTEDGTASTGRRHQPENTHNPTATMSLHAASVPQPEVQQTGEPPPAPRVIPVYLPPKAKSQRSHREARPSTATGAQSGSDTERVAAKHRMERTPSGPATQRSDAHTSTFTKDRGNHDLPTATRDDVRRPEAKYGAPRDTRQPLAPINVDIPLVTPGFNASTLPTETRTSTVPQIVSIRAGQGPSDPHDVHFKSSAILHSDVPQEIAIQPPQATSASIIKSSGHTRSHPYETQTQSDRLPVAVEYPHTEPHGDDLPPGQRVSIHESSRALPTSISKSAYARGNPETGVDVASSSNPHSRPPSRSTHRISVNNAVPPVVAGSRPLRSASQGPQTAEPPTRPPSAAHYIPNTPSLSNQHSVPPSPSHQANGGLSKTGHSHGLPSSAQPSPKNAQLHATPPSHSTSTMGPSPSGHPTPISVPQMITTSSRPSTRDGTHGDTPFSQRSADQLTADNYPDLRQTSNGTTVKASWVVQTPATAKKAKISQEEKYLRDHHFNLETPQEQLRQVLSHDGDSFPRASSSMMRASQATIPSTSSRRNSPRTKTRDAPGAPWNLTANNSPRSGSARETPVPEYIPRQNVPPHLAGPPQIAVVGPTPVTITRDLPQDRVDHALLAPPFPAPSRVSRTTSSLQDQQSQPPQPITRSISSTSYQPQLASVVHAPSLFQPYQPPSPPSAEEGGQFSPPPIPVPPPRGLEDSPPPSIETRTSEIIPTRSQSDRYPHGDIHSIPEVQSEMLHLPYSALDQILSVPSPRIAEVLQPGKVDDNTVLTAALNGSSPVVHGNARSSKSSFAQPDDIQVVHQEIMRSISLPPWQSPAPPPSKTRPKVTVEDVPEDSPVLSKGTATLTSSAPVSRPVQPSQHTTFTNTNSTFKPAAVDQPGHRASPQSKGKDSPLYRNTEPNAIPNAPPVPLPTPTTALASTRVQSSAPAQPVHVPPAQRVGSHPVAPRTYQRPVETLQASKPSTPVGATVGVNKATATSVQTVYNPVGTTAGLHQLANTTSMQGPSASRPVNAPSITAPHPNTSVATPLTKLVMPTATAGPGPSIGTLGPHTSALLTSIQPSSGPDTWRQQASHPGHPPGPPLDISSTTVKSTTAIKSTNQEQLIIDSTRPRDVTPSVTRNPPSSAHVYPISARTGTSSAMTQQTHVIPAQPSNHYRAVSLPTTSSSSVAQKPPSPRKYSQPITSATVSTQPFPSRPSDPESQPARVPVSDYLSTSAPVRTTRPSPDHTNDLDMLRTPSSIAPSPMLNPDRSNTVSQPTPVPIRERQASTDSKDDKKKASGLFGLFRTRTLSSKAVDPPSAPATRTPLDQGRVYPEVSVVTSSNTSVSRGAAAASAPRDLHSVVPPVTSTSTRTGLQPKFGGRIPNPVTITPHPIQPAREHRDATPHIFTPFKFLTMHSKRNRTVSAASLDVCDGNTATNTVIGSPDHSIVGQAQPLPAIIPPDVRDPLVAASEWRDREEADRRERRTHRIRRPGVTFDVDEEPPSPAPGTASRRKRLVRRPSGRTPTPGPPRS